MPDDILAIAFLIVMLFGAFFFRTPDTHKETVRVEKVLPPITNDEKKLGIHGAVVNALYDCVDGGLEVQHDPTSFEVPDHGLVNHMVRQLCLRSTKDNMEFFHTSTLYAGTRVYSDGAKLHDVCCIVHEKTTLTSIRLRFLALCENEDDGVLFVSMKFDPFESSIDEDTAYTRSGDCLSCHQTLDSTTMGYFDFTEALKKE